MASNTALSEKDKKLIRTVMGIPLLAPDEELNLIKRWKTQDDQKSLDKLTRAYLRLTVSMATKFRHYGLPLVDLIQEGSIGLMEAAKRFDYTRGVRFSTYANWWVRASMQDYILRNWSVVRTGTTSAHKALFFGLKSTRLKLKIPDEGPLNLQDRIKIASEMKVKLRDVEAMEGRIYHTDRSLNTPLNEDKNLCWQDLLESPWERPDDIVMLKNDKKVKKEILEDAMSTLTQRENYIIRERQLSDERKTLSLIGESLGISKERVRQVEAIAMDKLRRSIMDQVGEPREAGFFH